MCISNSRLQKRFSLRFYDQISGMFVQDHGTYLFHRALMCRPICFVVLLPIVQSGNLPMHCKKPL
ncbi:hypothetical protein CUMW_266150 [Citrus unshiu]|uniref:Uncharacterized protein n=1 Tax=Citrus unshiu TaxID=55188 RepID=A0A2H5QVS9_CITUN|nr:hypothetical protein CUMW_266150 [Citrus unshiu]